MFWKCLLTFSLLLAAEWDFGGFPAWLLAIEPAVRLRSSDPAFIDLVCIPIVLVTYGFLCGHKCCTRPRTSHIHKSVADQIKLTQEFTIFLGCTRHGPRESKCRNGLPSNFKLGYVLASYLSQRKRSKQKRVNQAVTC